MRLFIAIELNKEARDLIGQIQNDFKNANVRGNYSPEENLHMTLSFIGEYGDPEKVLDAMRSVSFEPFEITVDHIGRFEDTFWAGISDGGEVSSLAGILRRALSAADIPYDRKRFRPHVTFLRRPVSEGREPAPVIRPVTMKVDRIVLMRSERGKRHMVYTELGEIELRGKE